MGELLAVRNFAHFQHYRDRRPPWIKLYHSLWGEPNFFVLNEFERYCLIGLFVVASQNDNKIPNNQAWLKRELATTKTIPVQRLIDTEWVEQVASTMLADCVQDASPRALARVEKRREDIYVCFGEFKNVRLSVVEYETLKGKLNGLTEDYINRLDRWGADQPEKFARRKNHYATILNWYDRDVKEGKIAKTKRKGVSL